MDKQITDERKVEPLKTVSIPRAENTQEYLSNAKQTEDYLNARVRLFNKGLENKFHEDTRYVFRGLRLPQKEVEIEEKNKAVLEAGKKWGEELAEELFDPEKRRQTMEFVDYLVECADKELLGVDTTNKEIKKEAVLRKIDELGGGIIEYFSNKIDEETKVYMLEDFLKQKVAEGYQVNGREHYLVRWTKKFDRIRSARKTVITNDIPDNDLRVRTKFGDNERKILGKDEERTSAEDAFDDGFVRGWNGKENMGSRIHNRKETAWIIPPSEEEIKFENERRKRFLESAGRNYGDTLADDLFTQEAQRDLELAREAMIKGWEQDDWSILGKLEGWFRGKKKQELKDYYKNKFRHIMVNVEAEGKNIAQKDKNLADKMHSAFEDMKYQDENGKLTDVLYADATDVQEEIEGRMKKLGRAMKYDLADDDTKTEIALGKISPSHIQKNLFVAGIPWTTDWRIYTQEFEKRWQERKKAANIEI